MKTILVQIAAYSDDELPKTIASLLEQAKYPERLRFAIAHQYGPETEGQIDQYKGDARFRIHEVEWSEARGLGVARRKCNDFYEDEDFYFQIDAHMRAEPDWDVRAEREWESLGDERAILSSYPPAYKYISPTEVEFVPSDPNRLVVNAMHMDFIPTFFGQAMRSDTSPRGVFVAGGFQFGPGLVCREVPYERDICFIGEEMVHSMRLFAADYHIYSVQDQVLWHLYLRSEHQPNARHFWKDFQQTSELKRVYEAMNTKSLNRIKEYFGGKAGLNPDEVRAFENFAGVDLTQHTVNEHMYALPDLPLATDDSWRSHATTPRQQA